MPADEYAKSESGKNMMRRQATIANLMPFFNNQEQLNLQLLDKRVSKTLELVTSETPFDTHELNLGKFQTYEKVP